MTVLFSDLVDSTALSAQLDAEEWRDRVAQYHRVATEVVTRFSGHVAKYLGDGVLALFGYPQAHDDAAERAVRAGLAIIEGVTRLEALSVRVGLHTGATVVGHGAGDTPDVFGETPNIAARVQALARSDQVLMTAATHRLVSGLFIVEEQGPHALKGIAEPVALYRAVQPSGVRGRLARARTLTPFVGREHELRLLLERWERAREGDGQVVTIAGEAGIGKSRLMQQFRSAIGATPHTWIENAGEPLFTHTPFHPIAELLGQFFGAADPGNELATIERGMDALGLPRADTVPVLAPLLGLTVPPGYLEMALTPEQERRKLFAALVAMVQHSTALQPAVLFTEDVHWVDPSTLELIGLLCEQAPGTPMLLVLTARPEFRAPWPMRSHHTQLTLNRLSRADMRTMVREVVGQTALAEEVMEGILGRTDGVPLFVEELTRAMVEGDRTAATIPATLHDTLMARLDRLGDAREVAQVASVIGREFGYELVRRLCDRQRSDAWLEEALGRLAGADLVQMRGLPPAATYTFRHALVQEAAYESLLKSRRRELHAAVAAALGDAPHEVRARHLAAAGDVDRAITAWRRAGTEALQRSACREAEAHLGEAIRLLRSQPDGPQRAARELDLQLSYNTALQASRGYAAPETVESTERMKVLCEAVGDDQKIFDVLSPTFATHLSDGQTLAAFEVANRMVDVAERTGGDYQRCWAYASRGAAHYYLGSFAEAHRDFDRAMQHYDAEQQAATPFNPRGTIFPFAALAAWQRGRRETARRMLSEIAAAIETSGQPFSVGFVLIARLALATYDGRLDVVRQLARDLSRLGDELSFPLLVANAQFFTGYAMAVVDGASEGVALMRTGISALIASGNRASLSGYMRTLGVGQSHVGGDCDGALATFDEALEAVGAERVQRPEVLVSRAQCLARHAADPAAVEAAFRAALEDAHAIDALSWALRAATGLARVLAETRRHNDARAVLAPIYARFTEGLDDADLQDAKALLEELR